MAIHVKNDFFHHFQTLKASFTQLGYFRRGSLVTRYITCGRSDCPCRASPPRLHGPYFQFTRKVRGKTQTVYLSEQQAKAVKGWIEMGRRLDRIIAQMEQVSIRATDMVLKELPPRIRRTPRKRSIGALQG